MNNIIINIIVMDSMDGILCMDNTNTNVITDSIIMEFILGSIIVDSIIIDYILNHTTLITSLHGQTTFLHYYITRQQFQYNSLRVP